MKAKINSLKKTILLILFAGLLGFSSLNSFGQGQTASATIQILQQPCHNDGSMIVTVTGMIPPLHFYYYGSPYVEHLDVNGLTDLLENVSSCNYMYVYDDHSHYVSMNPGLDAPFSIDYPTITSAVCPNPTGTAQITINNGVMPAAVEWFTFQNYVIGNSVGTGNPISLPPGLYTTHLTDANGCTMFSADSSIYIPYESTLTYNLGTTVANCTNGTAFVTGVSGGVGPYSYHWFNNAITSNIGNLSQGSYNVTVADAQGCHKEENFYISQSMYISVQSSVTNATCLESNGQIIAFGSGGIPPYTYLYDNGIATQTVTGIPGETYLSIIVTDAHGCTGNGGAYVGTSTPVTATVSASTSSCTAPTGNATLTISGGHSPYSVDWNTFPPQTGVSLSNVAVGNYNFKITDADGCKRTGMVNIQPISNIYASLNKSNPECPLNNGQSLVSASGTNPPFTFLWSNGSVLSSLNNLNAGSYLCTITDNGGCSVVKGAYLTASNSIDPGISSTIASCLFSSDGTLTANAFGGTAPYTYHWSNGQTGQQIIGLSYGHYNVYIQDANGCVASRYAYVDYDAANTSCYCEIKGKAYADQNNNCTLDAGEQGVPNIMIHCSGMGSVFTNAAGNYSMIVPNGTYTMSESIQYMYPLASCQNNAISVTLTGGPGCVATADFANTITPLHDIQIITTGYNAPIPGNPFIQKVIIMNDGTVNEPNIDFSYQHDGQFLYNYTSPSVFIQNNPINFPNWFSSSPGLLSLTPGTAMSFNNYFNVPSNIPLQTAVNFFDSCAYVAPMTNWLNDYTPWNNVNGSQPNVVGSFDPNFKEVSPKGLGPDGIIDATDTVLTYIVHFQNTGSYYAENIVILDTIDPNLDINTIRPGYSDHNYKAEVSEDGVLKFTFKNVHLTWQAQSEINSCGLVTYSIKTKHTIESGAQIRNSASIFFDYNAPVITNTTLNTLKGSPLAVADVKKETHLGEVKVFPNPAHDELNIDISKMENIHSLCIYDVTGRQLKVENVSGTTVQKMDISKLSPGIYFVEIVNLNGEKVVVKFSRN